MRSQKIHLVIIPLLLSACSHQKDTLVQDVYNNQYDCAADWDQTVCEQENENSTGHASSGYAATRYLGPAYYKGNRKISLRGLILKPRTNLSISQPLTARAMKSASVSSPIRGGFGRGGLSFGG